MNNATLKLFDAVRDSAVTAAQIRELVADGAEIGSTDAYFTPLQLAVKNGVKADVIQTLLAEGADANACLRTDDISSDAADGYYEQMHAPLHIAAMRVDKDAVNVVKVLCKAGADVNMHSDDRGNVPLHHVRIKAVAEQLIKHGANVNIANADGVTPLLSALRDNDADAECIRVLLRAGADASVTQVGSNRTIRSYLVEYLERHPNVDSDEMLTLADKARSGAEESKQSKAKNASSGTAVGTASPWKIAIFFPFKFCWWIIKYTFFISWKVVMFVFSIAWWVFKVLILPFLVVLGIFVWLGPSLTEVGRYGDARIDTAAEREKANRRSGAIFRFAGRVFRSLFGL